MESPSDTVYDWDVGIDDDIGHVEEYTLLLSQQANGYEMTDGFDLNEEVEEPRSKKGTTQNYEIYSQLENFKKSIETPLHVKINDHPQTYMNALSQREKTSLALKSLLKEKNVSKSATEELFKFFNKYLKETNNG
jgi:hypothetical protein